MDKGVVVFSQKWKETMKNASTSSEFKEYYVVEKYGFNFRRDIIPNYLNLVKESSLSLFKLFKWVFHEMNSTNVWIRAMCKNANEAFSSKGSNVLAQIKKVQLEVIQIFDSLKMAVDEMLNMKNAYEQKFATINGKLVKVVELSKHVMCNEVGGLFLLNRNARKWLSNISSMKDMVVDGVVRQKTTSDIGPFAHTCNKTKLNAKADIPIDELVEVMNFH